MKIGSGIKKALKKGSDVAKKAVGGDKKSGDSKELKGLLGSRLSEKLGDKKDGKLDKSNLSEELFGKDADELSKEEKKKLKEIEKMLKGEKKEEKEEAAAEAPPAAHAAAPPAAPTPPQAMNSQLDQQLSQLAMSALREGMSGGGGSRQQLAASYQQAGGQQNMSISPQTHQLVDLALNGGGQGGLSLAGLGGGQRFPQPMGSNPHFGGMMAA